MRFKMVESAGAPQNHAVVKYSIRIEVHFSDVLIYMPLQFFDKFWHGFLTKETSMKLHSIGL